MNYALGLLRPYPFERLKTLLAGATPPKELRHIALSVGEPRHAPPPVLLDAFGKNLEMLGSYPATAGLPEFRRAVANWLTRRFRLPVGSVDPETMVLPVNGTREALFAFAQAAISRENAPVVVMPNPFYQIYEGAALLAGAEPHYMGNADDNEFLPDLDGVPAVVW